MVSVTTLDGGGLGCSLPLSGMGGHELNRALVMEHVLLVLVAEVVHRRLDDPTGRVAEPAQAATILERARDAIEQVHVDGDTVSRENFLVKPHGPVAADAARRAFAARLVGVEAQQSVGSLHYAR